jgi:molecular chaperone Hsp33
MHPESTPPASPNPPSDIVVRTMTLDGAFRLITVRTTDLVREVVRIQGLHGQAARILGDLVTATVVIRETMAPGYRVQAVISQPGHATVVADSHPSPQDPAIGALTRGLSTHGDETPALASLGPETIMKVMRSLPRSELHQSVIAAEGRSVSDAVMTYLQSSAQVFAMTGVATVVDDGHVVAAGGYLLQLLPDCPHGALALMTERLAHDFADLTPRLVEFDAIHQHLADEIFYGMPFAELASSPLRFGCDCDDARMLTAVATLGRDELNSIVAAGEIIDLNCEYCKTHYRVGPEQLRPLLMTN